MKTARSYELVLFAFIPSACAIGDEAPSMTPPISRVGAKHRRICVRAALLMQSAVATKIYFISGVTWKGDY